MNQKNNRFVRFGWLMLFFTFAIPTIVHSQTSLPPAAQEALDNGIIAAKVPDYVLAIRYFEEARKIAPDAPVIYFNLGLAESKIPGRELRAICWFSAFLAADPNSANASAVKEQIQILKIKSQSNVSKLITNLQSAADPNYDSRIRDIAELWANSGDVPTALKTAASIKSDVYRGSAQGKIAASQAQAGDFQGALKTAEMVERPDYQSDTFLEIAKIQIENGDLSGAESSLTSARRAADLMTKPSSGQLQKIAEIQIRAGNKSAAQATLKASLVAADLIEISTNPEYRDTDYISKTQAQAFIAVVQISAGDIEGAKQTLLTAFKNSELINNPRERTYWQEFYISRYQAETGDISNAIKTYQACLKSISQVADVTQKQNFMDALKWRQSEIAQAQAKVGDFAGALKWANEIIDQERKAATLQAIVEAQAKARDFDGATKTAEMIQYTGCCYKGNALYIITQEKAKANNPPTPQSTPTPQPITPKPPPPPLKAKEWIDKIRYLEDNYFLDLAGYLKTLPADNADKMFKTLYDSVYIMVARQRDIVEALKRKPTEQPK